LEEIYTGGRGMIDIKEIEKLIEKEISVLKMVNISDTLIIFRETEMRIIFMIYEHTVKYNGIPSFWDESGHILAEINSIFEILEIPSKDWEWTETFFREVGKNYILEVEV
jgi:hypothetical protein